MNLAGLSLVVLAGACGRFRIDALDDAHTVDALEIDARAPCTANIHDEDGDSLDDSCDVCPHIPDVVQADRDNDGVGDACDPEPDLARQQILLFDPFTSLDPAWVPIADERIVGDELLLPASPSAARWVRRPLLSAHDTFVMGFSAGPGTGVHIVSVALKPASGPGTFYCELYDNNFSSRLNFIYTYDDTNFNGGGIPFVGRFAPGTGMLVYEISSTDARCHTTWQGETLDHSAPRPPGLIGERLQIYAQSIDASLRYLVQIRTDD